MNKLSHPPVRSMHDLMTRKQILRIQIEQKEKEITSDYKGLIDRLTFRNLFTSLAGELAASDLLLSRAFAIGKFLVEWWKKRKRSKKTAGER